MSQNDKLRVSRERHFSAHHMLLGAARMTLEDAEKKSPGWFYNELITITFCALALEALANAFCQPFIVRGKDFESSSPIAKLRVICTHLGIEVDFRKNPWSAVPWLMKFRNKVAHAKPQVGKGQGKGSALESGQISYLA